MVQDWGPALTHFPGARSPRLRMPTSSQKIARRTFSMAALFLSAVVAASVQAQGNAELILRASPARLSALASPKPANLKTIPFEIFREASYPLQAAPADVIFNGITIRRWPVEHRTGGTYTGESRPTSSELRQGIELWDNLMGREGGAKAYDTELAFEDEGRTHWLPVYAMALGDKPWTAFKPGERHVLIVKPVGWLGDSRPIVVVLFGATEADFRRNVPPIR